MDPPPPSSGSGAVVVFAPSHTLGAHVELTTYDLGRYSTNFHACCGDYYVAGRMVVAAIFPRVPAALYYVTGFDILGRTTQVRAVAGEVAVVDWRDAQLTTS